MRDNFEGAGKLRQNRLSKKRANRAYTCPVCKTNASRFCIVYKIAQEIHQDPDNGQIVYRSDDLETLTKSDGQPDLEVRCQQCGYVGQEAVFIRQAERS
jgi:rubredoxin